jgi:toxin ParE1/3/4
MQIEWTRKALINFEHAIQFIAENNPTVAKRVAQKIWDSVRLLGNHPGIGRPDRVQGTRELIISGLPFIVPYTVEDGTIFILRVLHASRKWPEIL